MQKLFTKPIANIEASRKLAKDIYDNYLAQEKNFTFCLQGGLGAGKTFLIREILGHLGVEGEIPSPTYALVNEYASDQGKFAHFDFYRLSEPNDFFARGFSDIASDSQVSCFLEWPGKISPAAEESFSGSIYVLTLDFGIGVGMRKAELVRREK